MNGPSKLAASISSKQFFGLKFSFEWTMNLYFFLQKSIKIKQIYQAWTLKTNLKPKNGLLEIRLANLEGPFV